MDCRNSRVSRYVGDLTSVGKPLSAGESKQRGARGDTNYNPLASLEPRALAGALGTHLTLLMSFTHLPNPTTHRGCSSFDTYGL
jgi:hypothetical protein